MPLGADLAGLSGILLAIVTLLARLPQAQARPWPKRVGMLAAALVVLSVPLWGMSLAGFVRGVTGDLSIATLGLLALALVRALSGRALVEDASRQRTLLAIALAALLFYPLALGFGMFDPYRLGYGDPWFMLILLALAVWASLRYSTLLALCIALAVAAWSAGWYESTNLWDYLLDPWLAIYAVAAQLRSRLSRWSGRVHA